MALLWIDGFEGYGLSGSVPVGMTYRYPTVIQNAYMSMTQGRITGYGVVTPYNGYTYAGGATTPVLTTDPTIIAGIAVSCPAISVGTYEALNLYDNTTLGVGVTLGNTGLTVKSGATVLGTYLFTVLTNVWYYIEMKVFCHTTSGTVEVRLNGVTVISLSGVYTKQGPDAYHNKVTFVGFQAAVDDLYICDGSGDTLNDFQGACRVLGLFPNGDTATEQWTPSTGTTHYSLVDENPPSTGDYVSSSTQTQTDLYAYPGLVGTAGTILGLQINTSVLISSGSSMILEAPIVSGGATDLGPDTLVTSATYTDVRHISTTDPSTGLPWTSANLAAAQIGIRVM